MAISQEQIKELVGDGDVVIFEIGCADGVDTKRFLNTFGSGLKLYTFDPEPINIKYMTTLGSYDAWGGNNDVIVNDSRHTFSPYAMADYNGEITFNRSKNLTENPQEGMLVGRYSGSIHEPLTMTHSERYGARWPGCVFEEKVTAECKRIDTFCEENDISHINFIWMDTQGAEREVITGASKMLPNIDYIYTEYYDEEMYKTCANLEEIKSILTGFELIENWRFNDSDGGDALFKRVN